MERERELKPKRVLWETFLYVALALGVVTSLLPPLRVLSGSLRSSSKLFTWLIQWISADPRFQNFKDVLAQIPFVIYFLNTLKLSVTNTPLQVITCSLVTYAFSKVEFPGRGKLFLVYLGTMMVPFYATMIPQYTIMNRLKLINAHLTLILIQAFFPFGVLLLRRSLIDIPEELSEAARIDGCSGFMILFRIIPPLAEGALATLITFTFTFVQGDYLGPTIYLHKDSIRVIQIGLRVFRTTSGMEHDLILTGTVTGLSPLLIVYFTYQKYFTQSVTAMGLKEQGERTDMFTTRSREILRDGTPFVIRGYGLGNWMMLERFMFGFPEADQLLRRYFRRYAGQEKYGWLSDRYYRTYFQEKNARFLADMGCNTLRTPFNYRVFESDLYSCEYSEKPFAYTDKVMELYGRYGIYSVIDYHAVQGYKNPFHYSDNITRDMELYHNTEYQNRYTKLWESVAEHYKDNELVIDYDLIDEPAPKDDEVENLKGLYRKIVEVIRTVGEKHILFLKGPMLSNNFDCMDEVFDGQMAYTPHYYHNGPKFVGIQDEDELRHVTENDIRERREMSERLDVPCWPGKMRVSAGYYDDVRLHCLDITLDTPNRKQMSWMLWIYKDSYRIGVLSTAGSYEWRRRMEKFTKLKQKYNLDASNVVDWECTGKLSQYFEEDFEEYKTTKSYGTEGNRFGSLKSGLWCNVLNVVGEFLAEDYARLFAPRSEEELERMIQSSDLDSCMVEGDWYEVFHRRVVE